MMEGVKDNCRRYIIALEKNMYKLIKDALRGEHIEMKNRLVDFLQTYHNKGLLSIANNYKLVSLYHFIQKIDAPIVHANGIYTDAETIARRNWHNDILSELKNKVSYGWDMSDDYIGIFIKEFSEICVP